MRRVISLIAIVLYILLPQVADAHASLIESNPLEYAHLQKSPHEVRLTFNERLQKELYYIRVYNQKGQKVSGNNTKMTTDQTQIHVSLPHLPDGSYTVSYHIISADGHAVDSTYLFSIGKVQNDDVSQSDTGHSHGGLQQPLFYGAYYFCLLAFSGWILIGVLKPKIIALQNRSWVTALKFFFLLTCILLGLSDLIDSLIGFNADQLSTFFFHTSTGIVTGIRTLLAIVGFFLLQKNRWVDACWFLAILLLEAYSGHAAIFSPKWLTIGLDAIHLIAAAFWVGGLVYLLIHLKQVRNTLSDFLPFLSKGAFISLLVLIITGVLSTLFFLPNLSVITQSRWGILLILKVIIVFLVFFVAGMIRRRLKRTHPKSFARWLKADFFMMLSILMIVGAMTHYSPFPSNQPLEWATSRNGFHVNTLITPKNPGVDNTFQVTVSSQNKSIEEVHLILMDKEKKIAPLEVPLRTVQTINSKGKTVISYQAKGHYLTFSGKWKVEIQIVDSNDNYTILDHNMTIYQISSN